MNIQHPPRFSSDTECSHSQASRLKAFRPGAVAVGLCLCSLFTLPMADAAPRTGGGPGGIGPADGTGSLRLWLRVGDLSLADGAAVTNWPDASGYANHAVQGFTGHPNAPSRFYPPYFRGTRADQPPAVEFVRESGSGNRYGSHLRTERPVNSDRETYFIVSRFTSGDDVTEGALIGYSSPPQQGLREAVNTFRRGNAFDWMAGGSRDGDSAIRGAQGEAQGLAIITATRRPGNEPGSIRIFQNGELLKQTPHPGGQPVEGSYIIGAFGRGAPHQHIGAYHGAILEVALFATALNAAERAVIENHLAAKYGIALARTEGDYGNIRALTNNRLYWGDTDAVGRFDTGVIGIGRVDAQHRVMEAGLDGFGLRSDAFTDDNQWIFAGHAAPDNGLVRDGEWIRWKRVWYVQNPEGVPGDAAFHAADAGVDDFPLDPDRVRLLYRPVRDAGFSVLPRTPERVGETMVFRMTDFPSGYYTLGAAAADLSPDFRRSVSDAPDPPIVLRFDAPMTAMIHARHWDETHHTWHDASTVPRPAMPDALYFDAVHRFLLVRFPGSAEILHARMDQGYEIERVELRLAWAGDELRRAPGYASRAWPIPTGAVANWHAEVWALRKPWWDDPAQGPTWNGHVRGRAGWGQGGARCPFYDRFPVPVGRGGLWEVNPEAHVDVTATLAGGLHPGTIGERLRTFEQCGFLIAKAELYDHDYHQGSSIGLGRIFVRKPELHVFLKPVSTASGIGVLPPPLDMADAFENVHPPSIQLPDNLAELAAAHLARRKDAMPDWMWARVAEVRNLSPYHDHRSWFDQWVHRIESSDLDDFDAMVQRILNMPPAWCQGHSNIEFPLAAIAFGDFLPEVVHYHLHQDWRARWERPLSRRVFSHRMGGTLNHCAQIRSKVWLGSELTGDSEMRRQVLPMLEDLNRRLIYSSGISQELGDSYYRGITMAPMQAVARFGRDPVARLLASLMVEKLRFEDISTFHPGLRKRVSSMNRRMRENLQESLLLGQDVPEAALHTLSRDGVLIETDAEGPWPKQVHGMRVMDLHASVPGRVALVSPWGAEWEWQSIDRKPLPFLSVHLEDFHGRMRRPRVATTYLGRHYGLGSHSVPGPSHPVFAVWRRTPEVVSRVTQLGALLIQGRINEQPPGNVSRTPVGIVQHQQRVVWVMKPLEQRFLRQGHGNLPESLKQGLFSYKAQVSIHAFGPESEREVWINDQPVAQWPATARQGDVITVREGVTYLGLTALPATDLGRGDKELVIEFAHPVLTFDAYLLSRSEPLEPDSPVWEAMGDAVAGWVVVLGDEEEHGSFEAFRRAMAAASLECEWHDTDRLFKVHHTFGGQALDFGFRTDWQRRDLWHDPVDPADVIAYHRVGGREWPDLPPDVVLDNPQGQMGTAAVLAKGGAQLHSGEGRMTLLRVEPLDAITVGIQPFIEPQPFALITPGGIRVEAEGPLGMGRVTVHEAEGALHVDYHLPPPEGCALSAVCDRSHSGLSPNGAEGGTVRARSARALIVRGFESPPRVVLNGEALPGPFPRLGSAGALVYRIPIVR